MTGTTMAGQALLDVRGLSLQVARTEMLVVKDASLSVAAGEIVAIVGESGSGKTMLARSLMRLEPPAIRRVAGSIRFDGKDVTTATTAELRKLRGARMGMVFQEPMTSLNPSMTVGRQLDEGLALHTKLDEAARRERILAMLRQVSIPDPEAALSAYPHQFSGGMRQRIMLASAMLLQPDLLIADEPTTALDAVVQCEVLDLMVSLTQANGSAVLMISHDLALVARYAHRIVVMQKGEIVETGMTEDILRSPCHPYTRKLLAAIPRRLPARQLKAAQPVVAVNDLVCDYGGGWLKADSTKRALHGVSLEVRPGEVVALVGASGSGKTTMGRAIAGLLRPTSGEIAFRGAPVWGGGPVSRDYRLNCQMVFQDPYSSLDPRMTVAQLVGEAFRQVTGLTASDKKVRIGEVLDEVGLGSGFSDRYPHELSGGQRQRVAIARAVARRPRFIIADEPVSALDVTVRAQILDLFADLQQRHGFSCLFISHDLSVVEQVADRVVVLQNGRIVEQGSRDSIFDAPQHAYTRRLLSAIPQLEEAGGGVRLKWRFGMPEREEEIA